MEYNTKITGDQIKKKQPSKAKIIIFIVALLCISSFSGFYYGQQIEQQKADSKIQEISSQHSSLLEQREEELDACIDNRGILLGNKTIDYNPNTFGIKTELLDGIKIKVEDYRYNGFDVVVQYGEIDDAVITVSYISTMNDDIDYYHYQDDGVREGGVTLPDIPTFDGYENYALYPKKISEKVKLWNDLDTFTNKHDLTMYFVEDIYPGGFESISLQFFSTYSPLAKTIFVDISLPVQYNFEEDDKTSVLKAREELKKIADTIRIEL